MIRLTYVKLMAYFVIFFTESCDSMLFLPPGDGVVIYPAIKLEVSSISTQLSFFSTLSRISPLYRVTYIAQQMICGLLSVLQICDIFHFNIRTIIHYKTSLSVFEIMK